MSVYPTRGPINTAGIHFDADGKHFTVEDCGIPSMFARIARIGIDDRQKLLTLANPAFFYTLNTLPSITRKTDPSKDDHATEAELIDDVFFFNAMGEDDASGHFTLRGETLDLDWDTPIGDHPVFARIESVLQKLSQAMGGTYTPLPTWEGLRPLGLLPPVFNPKTLIVTHPLGGCGIGPTMSDGVVNEFGQVYDGSKKATDAMAVHPGLFIVDGSTMPGALAANPTLTISAQAIKVVDKALGPMPI
jgi:choline dehydrogenase-like flavoprotein